MLQAIPESDVEKVLQAHGANCDAILRAIAHRRGARRHPPADLPAYLSLNAAEPWHHDVYRRFHDIIDTPAFDYISKTKRGWLIVGDRRAEIAARILLVVEHYGLGVGMMVLHAHQMRAQHIPMEILENGQTQSLCGPTERLHGSRRESVLYVPVRRFRTDPDRLAELNIAKPRGLWDASRIVSHEKDGNPCFYCSAAEINPSEVIIDIPAARLGLSRNYSLGFTYAPFGNPVRVLHFLAWDCAENPFNMSRTPMTISDLVGMTRHINVSIRDFFAGTGIEAPVVDGISNGWAGNSIYHQHFQFFRAEYPPPITDATLLSPEPLLVRDDVQISRVSWETPVYKISADDSVNVGIVGNDIAGAWRLDGGRAKVEYRKFREGYVPVDSEKVPVHTQNLYVPGRYLGKEAYFILRDKRKIDYEPRGKDFVDGGRKYKSQPKKNIGVLEATGTMIVDDYQSFEQMKTWEPRNISVQIDNMAHAISPDPNRVAKLEHTIQDLFQ